MKKVKKIFCSARNFRLFIVLCMVFSAVAFIDVVAIWFLGACILWGAFILWQKFRDKKFLQNIQYYKVVFTFLILNIVSFVLHINHNFLVGFVYILYVSICFLMFYGSHAASDHDELKKEMFLFFKIMVCITLVLSLFSISTLFLTNRDIKGEFWIHYKKVFSLLGPSNLELDGYTLGIYQNRLTGIYTNANMLGLISVVGIVSSTILYSVEEDGKKEKFFPRVVLFFCIVVNLICLLLSDSNGAFLLIIIYITVFIFCKFLINGEKFNFILFFKRLLTLCIICILLISGSFVIRKQTQKFTGYLVSEVNRVKDDIDNELLTTSEGEEVKSSDFIPKLVDRMIDRYHSENKYDITEFVGRQQGENGYDDVSSGRIELWKQGLKMFMKHPVFGISRENFVYYGYIDLPPNGLRFPDLHNGYLSIAVANGAVGFLCFAIFGFLIALRVTRKIFRKRFFDWSNVPYKLFSFIMAYCAYALVEVTLLSQPYFGTIIFWYMLGFIMTYVVIYEKDTNDVSDVEKVVV